jgi:hypothetical protein
MPAGRGSFLTPALAIVRRPPSPKSGDPSAAFKHMLVAVVGAGGGGLATEW